MKDQRGNILFLILLAVVLFAALSYAVTSSTRGGGKDASSEKLKAMAAQMVQYGTLVENAVTRARTTGGIPEWGLEFNDGIGPSNTASNGSCTVAECRIFNNGTTLGQVNSLKFGEDYVDPRYRANSPAYGGGSGTETRFYFIQVQNIGTDLPDVVMVIPGIRPDVCRAINELLWNSATNTDIYYPVGATSYSGTLTSLISSTSNVYGNFFAGKASGCGGREAGGPYGGDFYHVVMPR
mgnify:CR=1 FL=1